MSEQQEQIMRALEAADRAALPGFPSGPLSDRWLTAFLPALAAEGLLIAEKSLLVDADAFVSHMLYRGSWLGRRHDVERLIGRLRNTHDPLA